MLVLHFALGFNWLTNGKQTMVMWPNSSESHGTTTHTHTLIHSYRHTCTSRACSSRSHHRFIILPPNWSNKNLEGNREAEDGAMTTVAVPISQCQSRLASNVLLMLLMLYMSPLYVRHVCVCVCVCVCVGLPIFLKLITKYTHTPASASSSSPTLHTQSHTKQPSRTDRARYMAGKRTCTLSLLPIGNR